ncbi:uncharacterized protein LOC6559063 [Drosophila grimshawi]|uniref:GH21546 n=1 Tax=Drosophila grimshawi TaxID=7222 RepID=B4J4F1_DROGR|nr:uncharacterized protein LOC6559063 [Drosophila grimshawi]EDW01633.1 GH21546 [Drosophila grimshawi]
MKQFAFFGVFFLLLAVAMATTMPEMPTMPMPGKNFGRMIKSGLLKQSAGQQGPPQGQPPRPPPGHNQAE